MQAVFFFSRMSCDAACLGEEPQIIGIGVAGVGLEDVVGKQDVCNLVLMDIIHHILGEIPGINDMYLFKGVEEIAWQGIAKAVLQYQEPTSVLC